MSEVIGWAIGQSISGFRCSATGGPLTASVQSKRIKKLFRSKLKLWNADLVRASIRTRRRPRRRIIAFEFKYEYDDEDDDNTMYTASFNPWLNYGVFVIKEVSYEHRLRPEQKPV